MKFKRKPNPAAVIPSASMSDIVFTLLLFFMVSTVIKKFTGLQVDVPEAYQIERLATKTHTSYIWIDQNEKISFDDYPVTSVEEIYPIASEKIQKDRQLLIFLRVDKNNRMGLLNDVQQQLRRAGALRIYYGTRTKDNQNY